MTHQIPSVLKNSSKADIDGLAQDSSDSSALALELLQSCAKLSIWSSKLKGQHGH